MDESSEELKSHIRSKRRELDDNLQALEGKVKDILNWRAQFQRYPMALLGAAFAGGALISAVLGRSGRSGRNGRSDARHVPDNVARRPIAQSNREASSFGATIWRDVKGAVGTAVTAQIYSVLGELISRVKEQAAERIRRPVDSDAREGRRKRNGGREQTSAEQN